MPATWLCFLLLHFSYDTFPNLFFRIVAEANETVFSHMKMLFLAYACVSLAEFPLRRAAIKSVSAFYTSRALVAVAYPWFVITFWFLAWALNAKLSWIGEAVYANAVTLLGIYVALKMEDLFEDTAFDPAFKCIVMLMFAIAVVVYVSFSLEPPIHFFTTPPQV